ncbi:hypothetical protein QFC21_000715 [Naganishia friedmannii]|uniref:Uncharacterized protein n=1 Tax=Naganishia friedmannii TaxID=89922 RepID=A0ACC2W772_9TREE|nr:hypothetical protein QFC21_000715 [Naganishia friedmannii]
MPKATQAAYRGPMKEYTAWALEWAVKNKKKLPLEQIPQKDRDAEAKKKKKRTLVTGKRVAASSQERVLGRPHKVQGKGREQGAEKGKKVAPANESSPSEAVTGKVEPTVGWKTLEQYFCALCYMQKQQMNKTGKVIHSPRRFPSIIEMMSTLISKKRGKEEDCLADRCKGGTAREILQAELNKNSMEGLRDRTMAALSHYGLLPGEDARSIQLPDVQHLPMDYREGPTQCDIMVILLVGR